MTVLGIETSTIVCAAALIRDGETLAEAVLEERFIHAEMIMSQIDRVLGGARSVDGIAVSSGPGSFTGLRIGVSTAKGLACAWNTPLLAVPTLESIAEHARAAGEIREGESVLALIDARRDEVYWQIFDYERGSLAALGEPRDSAIAKIPNGAGTGRFIVVGDGSAKCASMLADADEETRSRFRFPAGNRIVCSAPAVGRIGARLLREGKIADHSTLEPMYIKEFFLTTR